MRKQPASYLFSIQCVEPLHSPRVQFDGLCDVGQHLIEGMRRLLVEQDPDGLARLYAATDHRHQLGFDEVFALSALSTLRPIFGDGAGARRQSGWSRWRPARGGRARPGAGAGLPARDGDLCVVDLPVRLVWGTNVALTLTDGEKHIDSTNIDSI